MAKIGKSGGWNSSIGGTDYKSKGGKVYICGNQGDKGVVGSGPPSDAENQRLGTAEYLFFGKPRRPCNFPQYLLYWTPV